LAKLIFSSVLVYPRVRAIPLGQVPRFFVGPIFFLAVLNSRVPDQDPKVTQW
jgi:hypothetical protein